eukprot:1661403-Pleurochrysis_carterae.AAC.1
MGTIDINKNNPIYFDELSHYTVSLRPSRVICIVPQINIMHYWSNSGLGWERRYRTRHDRKCAMALSMFIAGSAGSLATNLQNQPA